MQLYNRNYRQVLEKTSAVDSKKHQYTKSNLLMDFAVVKLKEEFIKEKVKNIQVRATHSRF